MSDGNKKRVVIILAVGVLIGVLIFAIYDSPKIPVRYNSGDQSIESDTADNSHTASKYTVPSSEDGTLQSDETDLSKTKASDTEKTSNTTTQVQSTKAPTVAKTNKSDFAGVVNINTATLDELQQLNGIGPVIAQKIIDYRETHGGFSSIEEILEVSGIGEKKFANIRGNISIK